MELYQRMAEDLRVDERYILISSKRNSLYTKYYIDKKDGGKRLILHPSKELKVLQYWVCHNIFNKFPVSKYSMAYSKGCSIKKNAMIHKDSKYILHTDIVKFFESITRQTLVNFFKRNQTIVDQLGLTENDLHFIFDIVLYRGQNLVVGSVASPIISNCIMYEFDNKINELLLSRMENYRYTRYADDIIVSTKNYIEPDIINVIRDLLAEYSFNMNMKKTYFMNKKGKRHITGVVIDNNDNHISMGREKYCLLKRELYNYLVKGIGKQEVIKGKLSYLYSLDKDKYKSVFEVYKKYDKDQKIFATTNIS